MTHFVIVSDYNCIYEISSAKGLLQEFAGLFIYFCVMQQQMTPACISRVYLKRSRAAAPQWLRCYATNRKIAGSVPAGAIGIFH